MSDNGEGTTKGLAGSAQGGWRPSDSGQLAILLDVLGQSHDGVYAVDAQQRITYWSPGAERLTGHKASEVVGGFCYELMAGEDYEGHPFCRRDCPTILAARRGRGVPTYDVNSRTNQGEDVWLNMTIIPVPRRVAGKPIAIHVFRDVTERRRSELLARETVDTVRSYLEGRRESPEVNVQPFPAPAPKLTSRELQVLRCLARGDGTKKLAESLGISVSTARNHLDTLMRKLGVHSRLEAVVRASRTSLL